MMTMAAPQTFSLADLQQLIRVMYSSKDEQRGIDGTFMWLMEEIGELAAALREGPKEELAKEFADVMAWLATPFPWLPAFSPFAMSTTPCAPAAPTNPPCRTIPPCRSWVKTPAPSLILS
jgi:hypothetical protein